MSNDIREKFWLALAQSPNVMISLNKNADHAIPFRAQLDEEAEGCFWFFTTQDNRVAEGGKTSAQYSSKDHQLFASIRGRLSEEKNTELIDKYWSNQVEAWFKEGRDDPNLRLMRFDLDDAEVWTVDPSLAAMIKFTTGATVDPEETGEHEKLAF